ncbi:Serine protease inhibitor 7 [Capsicum annuum]|uniref:Serine protease inhibitor 7 n=1 Tax=Capsicum annuum TaxID=4072 RepID=A0A1U8G5C6_CAPAN|nr:serine protease inhibitor 1 [Capsicum annuum]KAF3614948.1 Serine protease inhibitor 7 [Capsicum annuum]KAF3629926.1 Serine protease inhibitor 7 [Capsicum annuum]PHT63513.1 Serine protease inhibitor 7 [Capsicum annuum]
MMKCLLLLCLCLLPFLAFSSNFTSENPIELPTVTSVGQRVFDPLGRAVETRRSYRISSSLWGALGGQVYLATTPNSAAPCPDGVFKYNSDSGPRGTPVRFIPHRSIGNPPVLHINQDFNIQFTTGNCDSYTVWKCGDYDASLDATLLGTSGGTIGQRDSSWFKLARAQQGYHLLNCPGPIACPSCVLEGCRQVWAITMPDGRRRLALARRQDPPQQLRFPLSVNFVRA